MCDKQIFLDLVNANIKREGIDRLLDRLEKSDFYTAPASTQYHDSVRGGLCRHSINVFDELIIEVNTLTNHPPNLSFESVAIVSLFHDICKIGFYEETTRNVKNEATGLWSKEPFYKVNDLFPMGHGEKSLYMVSDCLKLTPDEALAIRWHMSGFEPKENYQYISKAYSESPLTLLLSVADMKASYLKRGESK